MFSIYKYSLANPVIKGHIERILKIDVQNDEPYLWAEVDTSLPETEIRVFLIPTGDLGEKGDKWPELVYADTVILAGGDLVYHVYLHSKNPIKFASRVGGCHCETNAEPRVQAPTITTIENRPTTQAKEQTKPEIKMKSRVVIDPETLNKILFG